MCRGLFNLVIYFIPSIIMLKKQIGKYNHYKTDDWHYLYYYIINNGAMYKKNTDNINHYEYIYCQG